MRKQFTDDQITRGKKFEGVFGTDKGVYVVNSFAFNTGDLPADAVKHDGMVWFYSYDDADHHAGDLLPAPDARPTGRRRATTVSSSTGRTT